jgi:ATP-binding cassette subfamily B protein
LRRPTNGAARLDDAESTKRWWPGVFGFERPGWPQRRARIEICKLAWRLSRPWSVLLAALVMIDASSSVAMQYATGFVVGSIAGAIRFGLGSAAGTTLKVALGVLGGLFFLNNLVPTIRVRLATWLGNRVDNDLRVRLMDTMLAPVGIGHLEDPDIQDEVSRAGSIALFTPGGVVQGLSGIFEIRLVSLGSALVVATFHWWLAALLLLVALADEARARKQYMETARIVYRQTQDLRRSDYVRNLALGGAPKELRVFGMLDWVVDRFTTHWLETMREVWRDRNNATLFLVWAVPIGLVVNGGAIALVGLAAAHHQITIGRLATLSSAIIGIRSFISYGLDRTRTEYGSTAFLPILEIDEKIEHRSVTASSGRFAVDLPQREIRFEAVSFAYPNRDTDVYSSLDLTIPAGKSTAIVGVNGSGKTTLCKLLARCYEPTSGRITVDGVDLRNIEATSWQRRIAAIFQDYVRFPLSLADNITFGSIENAHDEDALRAAMARAGVDEFVDGLPHGVNTVLTKVFTDGTELSGGELQRVALARALFAVRGGAGVLVLDEPSASLDVRTEARLFNRYLELTRGVTSILISHRFSTVRHADRICFLHDGAVVEEGTHLELMARGGRYAEMFGLQASLYEEDVDA